VSPEELEELEEQEAPKGEDLSAFDLPGADRVPLDVRDIPLDQIAELPNIRQNYHGIEGLAETMYLEGQLQPCLVRPASAQEEHGKPYELIFGYRRKRAAEMLAEREIEEWKELRCEVHDVADGEELSKMIVENFQREKPSPVSEAKAMQALKLSCDPPMSNAEVARRLGCDPSQISHRLSLLSLGLAAPNKPLQLSSSEDDTPEDPEIKEVMESAPEPAEGETGMQAESPIVAVSEDPEAEEQAEVVKPAVDILDMVDKGQISASAAEVIASLDKREDQEKLAVLVKRHDWGVKKTAAWARQVKAHELDEGSEEMGPIEMLTIDDVTELPRLQIRGDLTEQEIAKVTLYALLRNAMDREMLDYLDEEMGYSFSSLWEYVRDLSDANVIELTKRMTLRYVRAAHRFHDLEPSLKDDLGAPEDYESIYVEEELALPAAETPPERALPEADLDLDEEADYA